MQKQRLILGLILLLVAAAITVLVKMPMRLGLDLQGGSQLTIQATPAEGMPKISEPELESIKKVIENRVNGLGVSEPLVQTMGNQQILVQLPGVSDPQEAEKVLGGTAQLDFREQKPGSEAALSAARQQNILAKALLEGLKKSEKKDLASIKVAKESLKKSNLAMAESFTAPKIIGKNLKTAQAESHQQDSGWDVALRFDETGGQQFTDLTKNLAGTGRGITI